MDTREPHRVSRRSANLSDVDWLIWLRQITMGPHLENSGKPLTFEEDTAKVMENFAQIEILAIGDEDIGMVKLLKDRFEWTLVQIQLIPEFQGRGVGKQLLGDILECARYASAAINLRVLRVNPAKRLYERLGFKVIAENDWSFEMRYGA
ncbi:MAG: GNAT family N-acetyltransferase [Pseudomonadales bacterium]|nr:GNAT family N-acetyltransferase [Pseudomonadales bacterium]